MPLQPNEYPFAGKKPDPVHSWDEWSQLFPHAPEEPRELDLLGSSKAVYCVNFNYKLKTVEWLQQGKMRSPYVKDITPSDQTYQSAGWCNFMVPTPAESMKAPRILPSIS